MIFKQNNPQNYCDQILDEMNFYEALVEIDNFIIRKMTSKYKEYFE